MSSLSGYGEEYKKDHRVYTFFSFFFFTLKNGPTQVGIIHSLFQIARQ